MHLSTSRPGIGVPHEGSYSHDGSILLYKCSTSPATVIELGLITGRACLLLERHHICWGKGYRIPARNTARSRNTYHKWDLDFCPCLNFSSHKFSQRTSPITMNTSYDKDKAGVCSSAGSATGFNFRQYDCDYQHLAREVVALSLEHLANPYGLLHTACITKVVGSDFLSVRR